jgi:AcrR family transcriptional regulator
VAQRTRLSRPERRAQLVGLGVAHVASSSFDDLSVDAVADQAGVARSLLYHYFPTRRDFQVAVAEAATDELLAATEPDPDLPPDARLRASLAAHVAYVSARPGAFLSLVRGAGGGSEDLRAVTRRTYDVVVGRVLDGLGVPDGAASPLLRAALHGWVAFVEEAVVRWLADGGADPDGLVALLEQVLWSALGAVDAELAAAAEG